MLRPSLLRAAAIPPSKTPSALADILYTLSTAVSDANGRWILSPHAGAQSEASWTGQFDGALRTLRADRIFRAGSDPLSSGSEYLWVVDYKATQSAGTDTAGFIASQREFYEPQLTQYGKALRKLHGESLPLRFALYFPRLKHLEYWPG